MPLCNGENMLPDSVTVVRVSAIVAMIIIILRPTESYDPAPLYSAMNQINLERECSIYCQATKKFSQYFVNEKNECICIPGKTAAMKSPFEAATGFLPMSSTSPTMDFDHKSLIKMPFEQMPPMSSYNDLHLIQSQVLQPGNYRVYFISSLGTENQPEFYKVEPQSYNDYPNSNQMIAFHEPFENYAGNDYSTQRISYQQCMESVLEVYPEESMHYSGNTGKIPEYIEEEGIPYYNYDEGFSNNDRRRQIHSSVCTNEHEGTNIFSQYYNSDSKEINIMHGSEDLHDNNMVGYFGVIEQNNENIVGSPLKDSIYIPQYSKSDHVFDESIFANGKSNTFPIHHESLNNLHGPEVPHPHENNPNNHYHSLYTPTIIVQTNTDGKSNTLPKIISTEDHINLQPISDFDNIKTLNNSQPNSLISDDPNISHAKPTQKLSEHNSEINFLSDDNDFGFPKSRLAYKFFEHLIKKPTTLFQSPSNVDSTSEKTKFQILDSTDSKETPNVVDVSIAPLRVQEKNVDDFFLTRANNYGVAVTAVPPIVGMIHIGSEAGTSPDQMHSGNGHVNINAHETLKNDLPHVLSIQNNYDNQIIINSRDSLPTSEITSSNLVKEDEHFVADEISKDIGIINFDRPQNIHSLTARLNLESYQNKNIFPPTDKQKMDSSDKTNTIAPDIEKNSQSSQLKYILTDEEVDTLPTLSKKDANSGVAEDEEENLNKSEDNYTNDELDSFTRNDKIASETIQENMFHDKLSKIFMDNINNFKDSVKVEVSQQIYLRIGKLFLPMYSVATGEDKVDLVLDGSQFCKSDMGMFADSSSDDFLDIVNFVCKQIKTD